MRSAEVFEPFSKQISSRFIRVMLVAGCCLLASCAAWTPRLDLPARSLPVEWPARAAELARWSQYSLRARVSVSRAEDVLTARLGWLQRSGRSELKLSSPLGVGGLEMTVDEGLEQTLGEALGVEVPLKSLRYWLLGIPDPTVPIEALEFGDDPAGSLPRVLRQAGWRVEFRRYAPVPSTGLVLPSRLDLQRDALEVRVFIEVWGSTI
jgi:outer membrane lipoprotein LolB